MADRVARHRADRDARFALVEEPLHLGAAIEKWQAPARCLLVDCLTLWLSNCLHRECWAEERQAFLDALASAEGHILLVSNETGLGVVPMGELSRRFVDEAGFLHQALGRLCERVTLVVAGLPMEVKGA